MIYLACENLYQALNSFSFKKTYPSESFRLGFNSSESKSFWNLFQKQFKKRFLPRLIENAQKSIRLNLIYFSLIRINPNHSDLGFILNKNSIWINPSSDWFEFIRIDSFGSKTDFGMALICSNWIPFRNFRQRYYFSVYLKK